MSSKDSREDMLQTHKVKAENVREPNPKSILP